VPAGQVLARGDDVRDDPAVVLEAEHPAGAREPGHHLICDQQHAVLVAGLPYLGQVAVRQRDDPADPEHRLNEHRRYLSWPHAGDHVSDLVGAGYLALLMRGAVGACGAPGRPDGHEPIRQRLGACPAES
jgi:hypothetical protein